MVDSYCYHGLALTQFMDLDITTRYIAQAAQRALGVLVAKSKSQGCLTFRIFTKLVHPTIDYGAAIYGHSPASRQ